MDTNLFTEGSVFYYENKTNSKKDYDDPTRNHDFVVSRPVYVLGSNKLPFDTYTVSVCVITSSEFREGIPINVDGYRNGKILPYAVHSFHKENLIQYMGQVSEEKKAEVRQAVAYHMGLTSETPPYIEKFLKREDYKKKFLHGITSKEYSVYLFLLNECKFKYSYCAYGEELFNCYLNRRYQSGYNNSYHFFRCVEKMKQLFPSITIEKNGRELVFKGFSHSQHIHRIQRTDTDELFRGVTTSDTTKEDGGEDIYRLSKEQLLDRLHPNQKAIYYKLDLVQKYQNHKKNPDAMDIVVVDHYNARVLKRILELDVAEARTKVIRQLSSGRSPFDLSIYNQYLVYNFTDEEIEKYINPKYRKKGTAKLKRSLKPAISIFITPKK